MVGILHVIKIVIMKTARYSS